MVSFWDCFGGSFWRSPARAGVFLEMRLTWLFSKEMVLPVSSSVLAMLAEPSCAGSPRAVSCTTKANHCTGW